MVKNLEKCNNICFEFHVYNLNYGFEWWITGYVIELLCNCSLESCLDSVKPMNATCLSFSFLTHTNTQTPNVLICIYILIYDYTFGHVLNGG